LVSAQSQSTSCPICLSTPVAPRMAKCGHIFCLPCLIRYMHSTDDTNPIPERKARWKKCPICEDSVYISDVRPCRWFVGQENEPPHEGNDVVLRLMKREYEEQLALPRDCADSSSIKSIPWYFAADVMDYARIMKGSEDYMQSQFDKEISDIELQEKEDELMFGEENQWTRKAIASIRDAKERVTGIGNHPSDLSQRIQDKRPMKQSVTDRKEFVFDYPSSESIGLKSTRSESTSSNETQNTSVTTASLSHLSAHKASTSSSSAPTFFFYQALLHYYLAPLDIRILKAAFGDYSLFPSAVLPRVEHVTSGHIVDDDLRRRAKYLGHLPHGCEVGFLECDWTDIVPPAILEKFSGEIERRRKRNKEKEMREEKERLRAEKEEDDKRWAAVRRRRPSLPQNVEGEKFTIGPSDLLQDQNASDSTAVSSSPPWPQNRTGFASLASPSTSPSGPKTVWGTTIIPPSESPILQATKVRDEHETDGWLQGWEQDLLREEELVSQVQAASLADNSASGKKKKHKKITLMSTNGRRAA
jgi:hypothetical protein